jgi:MFS superfamily sulfate permease-like transporter
VLVLYSFSLELILLCLGVLSAATFAACLPKSVVVGFTIGIKLTIALTQIDEVPGISAKLPYPLLDKIPVIAQNTVEFKIFAVMLWAETFLSTQYVLRISFYIPGIFISIGLDYVTRETILKSSGLTAVKVKYLYCKAERFIYPSTRRLDL